MIPRMMAIPKEFMLLGRRVRVKFVADLAQERLFVGLASPADAIIQVQCSVPGRKVERGALEQTFCHELVHMILDAMGEKELYANERFVDVFACLLHQVCVTAEFKESTNGQESDK